MVFQGVRGQGGGRKQRKCSLKQKFKGRGKKGNSVEKRNRTSLITFSELCYPFSLSSNTSKALSLTEKMHFSEIEVDEKFLIENKDESNRWERGGISISLHEKSIYPMKNEEEKKRYFHLPAS